MEQTYWLMKTEPACFSITDLANKKNQTATWDGVRNYQARNFLKAMKLGDQAFFYHSSCAVPGIVGIIKIIKPAYPDLTALDLHNEHYDPKSTSTHCRWYCVDIELVKILPSLIPLTYLRQLPLSKDFSLLKRGNRLSILPVTPEEWKIILEKNTSLFFKEKNGN